MTSSPNQFQNAETAYVWIWLPGATSPVVAGKLVRERERLVFSYGKSYLDRKDRISIFEPELPLRSGAMVPQSGLSMPGCLRDASPDTWGRRVILNRLFGRNSRDKDDGDIHELTYLLESGSDRIGALDFQHSSNQYEPRVRPSVTLIELQHAAEKVERGEVLTPELEEALVHCTSLGGARPKALLEDSNRKMIAKFSSSTDTYNVVKAEYVAMRLATEVGLNVAPVNLTRVAEKDVLLVERFDREETSDGWVRRAMVSALTLFGLDEMMARYASYEDLAEIVRHRFTEPRATLHELYGRLVFNVLCGNTDDHARNHMGFWNGEHLTLTPAYDICPQNRTENIASQAMRIVGNNRSSNLATCIEAASKFHLKEHEASDLISEQIRVIRYKWNEVCEEATMSEIDRNFLSQRIFFNESIFEGADRFRH